MRYRPDEPIPAFFTKDKNWVQHFDKCYHIPAIWWIKYGKGQYIPKELTYPDWVNDWEFKYNTS